MRRLAGIAVLLAATVLPASAGVVEGMFEIEGGCFVRKYDPAHLRAHPDQVVTQISLETSRTQLDREHVILDLEFTTRQGTHYSALASCTRDDRCGIEGDGGSYTLRRTGPQIRMSVGDFLAVEGDRDFSPNLAESDDRVFLLNPC